jgi:hypothetical protein
MKLQEIDLSLEQKIVMAMATETPFLREMVDLYSPGYLTGWATRVVADWCVAHYQKYHQAPGSHLREYYDRLVKTPPPGAAPGDMAILQTYLTRLSSRVNNQNLEPLNLPFLMDEAERLWRTRDLEGLSEKMRQALQTVEGDQEAEELLRKYRRLERMGLDGFNPFQDESRIEAMFAEAQESLLLFPGALGDLLNDVCCRDQFIGLMGPEKSGKTFYLLEFFKRACMARCNVALFETGDMSESQLLRRSFSGLCGKPYHRRYLGKREKCCLDCRHNQTGECPRGLGGTIPIATAADDWTVPSAVKGFRVCPHTGSCQEFVPFVTRVEHDYGGEVMTPEDVRKMQKSMVNHLLKAQVFVDVKPANTVTMEAIHNKLVSWKEKRGFVPDVIIIDYADILAKERGVTDEREAQNTRWMWGRRLSQEWHSMVVLATQSDAGSYDAENLSLKNFSEDKRKYSHVTAMLGIHRTLVEHDLQLARLSFMLGRELEFSIRDQVVTIQDLRICNPLAGSFWRPGTHYRPKTLVV